jgi:ABC-type sugar transport system ATPase subunit
MSEATDNVGQSARIPPLLQVRDIEKSFPGVRALSGVSATCGLVRFTRY